MVNNNKIYILKYGFNIETSGYVYAALSISL